MTDAKEWLIRKNGYFYRPNKSGYTLEKAAAGRYTKDDADREAAIEPHNFTVIHESEVEDSPQVVDLYAEITTLRKELAEARAENERLKSLLTITGETYEALLKDHKLKTGVGEKVGCDTAAEWALETEAFNARNRNDVPKDVQDFIQRLWEQYCLAAAPSTQEGGV